MITLLAQIVQAVKGNPRIVGGSITRQANTTPYAANQLLGGSASVNSALNVIAIDIAYTPNALMTFTRARVKINDSAWAGKQVKLHVYKDLPTLTVADGGNFNSGGAATESNKIGEVTVTFGSATSDSYVKGYGKPDDGAPFWLLDPSQDTTKVYVVVETLSAVSTPAASKTLAVVFESPNQS